MTKSELNFINKLLYSTPSKNITVLSEETNGCAPGIYVREWYDWKIECDYEPIIHEVEGYYKRLYYFPVYNDIP